MKIINISKVKPHYDFPEWNRLIQRGYWFYINDMEEQYKVLLRLGNWLLCAKYKLLIPTYKE